MLHNIILLNHMAEKSKDKKIEKKHQHKSGGEMAFGMEVLLFVVAIFIIWVLMGGSKKPADQKPYITPLNDTVNPGMKYGSSDSAVQTQNPQ